MPWISSPLKQRLKLLAIAGLLPALSIFVMGGVAVYQMLFSLETTYRTTHVWNSDQFSLETLQRRIDGLGNADPRILSVVLDPVDIVPERCGKHATSLVVKLRDAALSQDAPDLHDALLQQAYGVGLGPECTKLSMQLDMLGSDSAMRTAPFALLGLVILLLVGLSRRGWRPLGGNWAHWQPRVTRRQAARQGMVFAVGLLASIMALATLQEYTGWFGSTRSELTMPSTPSFVIFMVAVFAPVFEEYVYRAWLLERLTYALPSAAALLLSTLAFVAIHFPSTPFEWVNLLVAGLALGWLWLRTRSLLAVVLAHALYNLSVTLMQFMVIA